MNSTPTEATTPAPRAERLSSQTPDFSLVRSKWRHRLQQQWQAVRGLAENSEQREKFATEFRRAQAWVDERKARVPAIDVDSKLPISAHADELIKAIQRHRVVIVAGETGSGKSTQLPKLCLAAGRGARGLIACTQPRRIAAKTVARRVAEELRCELGDLVGWQVRFTDAFKDSTMVKFMTDGILLAETQSDHFLSNYDTIIIDEAHERSLNIDFLLGFLKRLLPKRPDLKLIITSATIDTERFSKHFDNAPVFQVEGRGYPVEVRYRPLLSDAPKRDEKSAKMAKYAEIDWQEQNLNGAVISAVEELNQENPMADILVFFPGEREIRECQQALQRRNFRDTEILPLYARLSGPEQDRVFKPEHKRRIILASNVAETSITVPRIRYVIDSGVARIARYSPRSKIERLHIEAISQASANQRAGRCGRISAGVCIRLYDEQEFKLRPAFTDPEILRSALAGVLLRMLKLRLGDPRLFPFVEAPEERSINDGYLILQELGAIDHKRQLTPIGEQMADLPIDVHYARMLIAASMENCLQEALVVAAALAIQDPRERPADARGAADAAHQAFADERSDFLSLLKLWEAYQYQSKELTQNQLRNWAKASFLSFLRLREWRDLHQQLLSWAEDRKLTINAIPASVDSIHRALLAALIAQVGEHHEKGSYISTRGRRFQIFPGSAIKGTPRWIMSDTLLDTQKVWAIGVAKIEPAWIETIGAHLIKKRHYDAFWDARAGRVMGFEDQSLLGLLVVQKRRVQFEKLDPVISRELFLLHAFGLQDVESPHRLFAYNAGIALEAKQKEEKLRTRGLMRSASEIAALFSTRIPGHILSVPALVSWLKTEEGKAQEAHLRLSVMDFLLKSDDKERGFPDEMRFGAQRFALQYHFDPSSAMDGISLTVKLDQLGTLTAQHLDWLVPGLRDEKAQALIKSLPKHLRRMAVPAPDFSKAFLEAFPQGSNELSMAQALASFLSKITGGEFAAADFSTAELPKHLSFNVQVLGPAGEILEQGRDLLELQGQFRAAARAAFTARMGELYNRNALTSWPFDLPQSVRGDDGSTAYPALVFDGKGVNLRAFADRAEADLQHPLGVLQLIRWHLPDEQRYWRKHIALSATASLVYASVASSDQLRIDIVEACLRDVCLLPALATRSQDDFHRLATQVRDQLGPACQGRAAKIDELLNLLSAVKRKLKPPLIGYGKANFDDIEAQLKSLVFPGFVLAIDAQRLQHYPRYLKALSSRVDRLLQDAVKDQQKLLDLLPFLQVLRIKQDAQEHSEVWQSMRWAVEEMRVSIFAPELKTAEPVSIKRLMGMAEKLG